MTAADGVTGAEYQKRLADQMTEAAFQRLVIETADRFGWIVYHTHDSRRSNPGYPDLHLVHAAAGRSIFRELKTSRGRVRPAQEQWLAALTAAGCDADVWRPGDWFSGLIPDELANHQSRSALHDGDHLRDVDDTDLHITVHPAKTIDLAATVRRAARTGGRK